MRRTITTLTALAAATALAACSPETATEETETQDTVTSETTEATTTDSATETDAAGETATDGAAGTADAAGDTAAGTADAGAMSDPVCSDFFAGQGTPLAERAVTQREVLDAGDPLDPVSFSEVSLLKGRIQALVEDADADQAALLERINAPFTTTVDEVVAADARLAEEIPLPEGLDLADSEAAQDEFEAACAG